MKKSMKIILVSALLLISGFAHADTITITNNTDNRVQCIISSYYRGLPHEMWTEDSVFVDGKTTAQWETHRSNVGGFRVYSSDDKTKLGEWTDRGRKGYGPSSFTIQGDKTKVTISV